MMRTPSSPCRSRAIASRTRLRRRRAMISNSTWILEPFSEMNDAERPEAVGLSADARIPRYSFMSVIVGGFLDDCSTRPSDKSTLSGKCIAMFAREVGSEEYVSACRNKRILSVLPDRTSDSLRCLGSVAFNVARRTIPAQGLYLSTTVFSKSFGER